MTAGARGSAEPRQLIVTADDFGMSPGVNAGIIRAHREGIVTNASLMVNAQARDEAVGLARDNPHLSLGLHLVLVQGRAALAAAEAPLLVRPDGCFSDSPVVSGFRYFFVPSAREQVRREVFTQIEKFLATGCTLSHVDGHLNIHMHPVVVDILIEAAERYGVRAVRLPREPLAPALRRDRRHLPRKLFEAAVFGSLSRWAGPRLDRAGVRYPDRVFGLHQSGRMSERYLLDLFGDLPPGVSEVYCHPAVLDGEARRWRPAEYDGELEMAALTGARVRQALAQSGIALISYRDL